MREDSVYNILISGPEERSAFRSILRLLDFGMLVSIFWIGIVGMSPLVLPTEIVGIAIVVADFVILDGIGEALNCRSCGR